MTKRGFLPARIISGGQTGVDRAALDVALERGIACGGWCPRGRRAEDGIIPEVYPLKETSSEEYAPRTTRNVLDADATLIITRGPLSGGSALTAEVARRAKKPYRVVDLQTSPALGPVKEWLARQRAGTLNVAGPRESGCPGIYEQSLEFLRALFAQR